MRSITTKGMLLLAVMAMMFAAMMAAPVAQAQTGASPTLGEIQANPNAFIGRVVTITGTVGASVDRNEFLFDDGTGQIVVDPGPPWFRRVTIANGTRVTITGEIDRMRGGGVDLDACQIVTPAETIQIRDCSFSGPPPWAGRPNQRSPRAQAQANPAPSTRQTQANPAPSTRQTQANPAPSTRQTQANPAPSTRQTQANPALSIGQIQSNPDAFIDRVVTLRGTVGAYVDSNEFLFDDGTGQIVVDPGPPWFRQITVATGTQVAITGEIDRMRGGGVDLDACQIITPTETIQIRDCSFSGPPPWAGGPNRRGPRP